MHTNDRAPRARVVIPSRWLTALEMAFSEHDVVNVVREYLATWAPHELARLPRSCIPGPIKDGLQIADYAFVLAHEQKSFGGALADGLLLDRMMVFFSQASVRLAQIAQRSSVKSPQMQ